MNRVLFMFLMAFCTVMATAQKEFQEYNINLNSATL